MNSLEYRLDNLIVRKDKTIYYLTILFEDLEYEIEFEYLNHNNNFNKDLDNHTKRLRYLIENLDFSSGQLFKDTISLLLKYNSLDKYEVKTIDDKIFIKYQRSNYSKVFGIPKTNIKYYCLFILPDLFIETLYSD